MRKVMILFLVPAALLVFTAGPALAGAFRIPEAGAKAMGLSNAFVGLADDPSAIQFNPAGITQLDGNEILVGGTSITTNNDYTDPADEESSAEEGSFFPPFFYYSNHIGDSKYWFGLGITSPFGLGTEWDVSTFDMFATKTELEMVKINPTLAYQVNEKWSLAFGVDYYQALSILYANNTEVPIDTLAPFTGLADLDGRAWVDQELSGDGTSYGFNLAAHFKPSDQVQLGFVYRSGSDLDIDGDIKVDGTKIGSGETTLKLPDTAALGIAYMPTSKWTITLDLDWTGWSAYDELVIDASIMTLTGMTTQSTISTKDYEDTIAYRIGTQYQYTDRWAFRAGILMEKTPVPEDTYEPRLPDGDRIGYSVGVGYEEGPWTVDFAYMIVLTKKYSVDTGFSYDPDTDSSYNFLPWMTSTPDTQTVDGDYEGDITLIGFNVGYAF